MRSARSVPNSVSYIITPVRPNVVDFTPPIQNLTRRILRRIDARASLLLRPRIRAPRGFSGGLQGEHLPVSWISPRVSPRRLQPQLRTTTAKEALGKAASRETASRELKHASVFLTRLHHESSSWAAGELLIEIPASAANTR